LTEHYENLEASEKELAKYKRVAARVGKVYSPSEDSVELSPYRFKKVCAYIESICGGVFVIVRFSPAGGCAEGIPSGTAEVLRSLLHPRVYQTRLLAGVSDDKHHDSYFVIDWFSRVLSGWLKD
jgi:hypothetical protein